MPRRKERKAECVCWLLPGRLRNRRLIVCSLVYIFIVCMQRSSAGSTGGVSGRRRITTDIKGFFLFPPSWGWSSAWESRRIKAIWICVTDFWEGKIRTLLARNEKTNLGKVVDICWPFFPPSIIILQTRPGLTGRRLAQLALPTHRYYLVTNSWQLLSIEWARQSAT